MSLHHVVPEDWRSHRALRLDMLEADPDAFWADPHEARARDERAWRAEITGPRSHLQARRGSEVLGGIALLPAGYTPEHEVPADRAHIVSLWVRPTARGRGVCRMLLAGVARLALELGRPCLHLDVDSDNAAAQSLYLHLGFTATGAREPREERASSWVEYAIDASRLLPG